MDISQTFWSQNSFKFLKLIKNPQKLLFIWVKSIFAIVEIKTEILKLLTHLVIKINPLHVSISDMFYEKMYFQKQFLVRRLALFYIFADLPNI